MKKGENNKNNDSFLEIAAKNYEKVQTWPDWMQSVTINASTASTGHFFESTSVEKKEKRLIEIRRALFKYRKENNVK